MPNKILRWFFILIVFVACAKKAPKMPDVVIPTDEFSALMMDIRLAETNQKLLTRAGGAPENFLDSSYQLIYKIHDVTPYQVDTSFKWYAEHPELLKEVDQKILENLNRLQ